MSQNGPDVRSGGGQWPQDARLAQALRHAPEPAQPPGVAVRAAVLAHARARLGSTPAAAQGFSGIRLQWSRFWRASGHGPLAWGGALGSVLVVVLAGVLWGTQERRESALELASAPVAVPAPQSQSPAVAEVAAKSARSAPVRAKRSPAPEAASAERPGTQPAAVTDVMPNAIPEAAVAVAAPAPAPKFMRERSAEPAGLGGLAQATVACRVLPESRPCDALSAQRLLASAVWRRALAAGELVDKMPDAATPGLTWLNQPPATSPTRIFWAATERRLWWEMNQERWQTALNPEDAAAWQILWNAARLAPP